MEPSMKNLLLPVSLLVTAVLAAPVAAQGIGSTVPGTAPVTRSAPLVIPHIANTGTSLSTPATSPLQQQMQDNYATQLQQAQRQLLLQNPSGLSRGEEGINRQLNGFTPQ
jgi:hypothetical protein